MILTDAKTALRITTDKFDNEIQGLIDACKKDLQLVGVVNIDETDPLIQRAIFIYVKANFGYEEKPERFQRSYDLLKLQLRESGEYNAKQMR